MSSFQGEGVQVVGVTCERKLRLDEAALRRVLHERLRALPVLVLSVAGAFRGGKSFILDFVLRYLNASESSRSNGEWLGQDEEPLRGFSWRSGVERNTIGIHLWSTPHVLTTPSGEKVAVVLMDTQGTFDNESTMRECTSIFALSTLMSSIQVYNISQNLKENDLYQLELFTGYAKLVLDEVGKPLQNLTFLIRDWNFPDDYGYGYQGGKLLLEKKLQVNKQQPAELQVVREHIHSSFERIECFLMPHPGFAVNNKSFDGKLSDLRLEFKESLLELIPELFTNLQPKMSSVRKLTVGDLASYFREYITMFNSDALPTPSTILKATAKADLMLAIEAARAKYLSSMGGAGAGDAGRALPPAALRRLHADAAAAATLHLTSGKSLADRSEVDLALEQLTEELESLFTELELTNDIIIKKAIEEALSTYVKEVLNGCKELEVCVSSMRLEEAHYRALDSACTFFDRTTEIESREDKYKNVLIQEINKRYGQLRSFNKLNNTSASSEAAAKSIEALNRECNEGTICTSNVILNRIFSRHRREAIADFNNKRSCEDSNDKYVAKINQILDNHFKKLKVFNIVNSQMVHDTTMSFYDKEMNQITQGKCLPSKIFIKKEKRIRNKAMSFFKSKRTHGSSLNKDRNLKHLVMELKARALVLEEKNTNLNIDAVDGAMAVFHRSKTKPTEILIESAVLVVGAAIGIGGCVALGFLSGLAPIVGSATVTVGHSIGSIIKMVKRSKNKNAGAKFAAIAHFIQCRADGRVGSEEDDEHYQDLLKKLHEA